MIEIGTTQTLTATCARGLERVLADELRVLGAEAVAPDRGSVLFAGDLRTVYNVNIRLRTAMRVLVPLVRGQVTNREGLYELAASVVWKEVLGSGQTFAVEVVGKHRSFRNTTFAGQVVKDAVVDRLRTAGGGRPNVDRDNPDIRLHLRLVEDGPSTLSLDSSGEPLSHRGYRPRGGPAPLAETLAAGILLLADYDGSEPLLDPMCGTGTFAVEAALIATRTPPGLHRSFAFERWPVHSLLNFEEVQREASHGHREAPQPIVARDRADRALRATHRNLKAAWMDSWVELEQRDALDLQLPWGSGGMIVANPPYGKRVGEVEKLFGLYRRFGDSLKNQAVGTTAWVLAGEPRLAKSIGLKAARKIPLFNGPIECRLLKFEMYEGTRKHKAATSQSS
ncbi:MAG: THUMP domain-containing protein [Acidobacteriota bacterium]|nr:THUMP domain-containing protein [Acidobacteriota bacterium]